MPIDDRTKKAVVRSVLDDLRVWLVCKDDPVRCAVIADCVWATCAEIIKDVRENVGDRELLQSACTIRLEARPDYKDVTSFIPHWALALMLKIIVGLLIDWWFSYEKGGT
jgi:hypothetical protein